jgi:imidazolonepropionase-like amidohydrolase
LSPRLVIAGGPILSVSGSDWRHGSHVVVEGDTIVAVQSGGPGRLGPDDAVIDLDGRRLLPGLIDSHFHLVSRSSSSDDEGLVAAGMLEGVVAAITRLAGGVTSVRDCGCRHHGIHHLRRAIDSGLIAGPTALVAGRNPTSSRAPQHWRNIVADGPEAMAAAVKTEAAAGADFVKLILSHAEDPTDWATVTRYIDDVELAAAVAAAKSAGVRTGVHCEGWDEARRAVAAGIDVLDHAPLIDEETATAMAARGVVYVPTIWAFSDDSGLGPDRAMTARAWQAEHRASVARAQRAGVCIAAGSDAAGVLPPHDVLVEELHCLSDAGLTNVGALQAATTGGAVATAQGGRLGLIAAGGQADLVVVDGDPLEDLDVLRTPSLVVARGRRYDAARLRAEWCTAAPGQATTARWAHA